MTIATDVTTTTYTTGNAQAQDFTFEITVGEVEAMNAAIKIVPTDETATFCWMVAPWDGQKTATEVMDDIVAQYGNFMNNGAFPLPCGSGSGIDHLPDNCFRHFPLWFLCRGNTIRDYHILYGGIHANRRV